MSQTQYIAIMEAIAISAGIIGAMWTVVLFMLYDIKRMIGGRKIKKVRKEDDGSEDS